MEKASKSNLFSQLFFSSYYYYYSQLILVIILASLLSLIQIPASNAISIKPADFERLIMPCYGGGVGSSYGSSSMQSSQLNPLSIGGSSSAVAATLNGYTQLSRSKGASQSANLASLGSNYNNNGNSNYQTAYSYSDLSNSQSRRPGQGYNGAGSLSSSTPGQQVPRASTIDNFIALVSKIEAANPRLATNIDQFIRSLLGRFRMDDYYYDVRARTPISEQDHRTLDIIPAIFNLMGVSMQQQSPYGFSVDDFPEQILNHEEKCSMYFMLSHFVEKTASSISPPLSSIPVSQLTGPQGGQRPPVLQAAGSGYPSISANNALTGGASGSRYPGPSPSFGSPATSNMNAFGSGISSNPDYSAAAAYGTNVPQPLNQFNMLQNNMRNSGPYAGTSFSNSKYSPPYIDGNSRSRDERQALEFGVVSIANQENSAIVLNRVLMGILAASSSQQTIRQLAEIIYPNSLPNVLAKTPKIDNAIDPLYAVTLADLWAIGSIPKAGKLFDIRMLGDNGRWNDTICPTSFQLDRPNSIRFTTAELIGGLDGFNLGMFRRRLIERGKNLKLSELLRLYYSKTGFRPQFSEYGVCTRVTAINNQIEELKRQATEYLRLYQLNLPTSDNDIELSINRLDSFKEVARQAANNYSPPELCQDSSYNEGYSSNQDECEVAKADVVTVLDSSAQANDAFMQLVVIKLAHRLGLSRHGSSLSVLTNQQDTSGYAGSYSFNAIINNSTNTAEIGCSIIHDSSRTYSGGQITEPSRLMEMFERALVNLDSEYITRQRLNSQTSSYSSSQTRQQSYSSSWFGNSDQSYYVREGGGPKSIGGAKVIIWFNYGSQQRASSLSSYPTSLSSDRNLERNNYKFQEAKKYLRENFRGASILAITSSRDEVKPFVFDEEKDIFTDIPQGNANAISAGTSDYYPPPPANSLDSTTLASYSGNADQLVSKLIGRICEVPAIFQYPMCFRNPSENTVSVGYISPQKKQNWMMSPKTFFASQNVRMVFKVEGGRLRVCFGRMPKPDESAQRGGGQFFDSGGSISLTNGPPYGTKNPSSSQQPITSSSSSNGNTYYTGLEHGVCKDVSPGQEIDFIVSDPCYKKAITECEPFYYVIKELTNQGEGDPNYMCRDEGCKRFDQVKFTFSHTGVTCGSFRINSNWLLIIISLVATLGLSNIDTTKVLSRKFISSSCRGSSTVLALLTLTFFLIVQQVRAQQAGVYDFGQDRYGERRGSFTPSEVLALVLLIMVILAGLALTIGLCYYVAKQKSRSAAGGASSRLSRSNY